MVMEVDGEMEVMTPRLVNDLPGDRSEACDRLRQPSYECQATSAYGYTRSVSC